MLLVVHGADRPLGGVVRLHLDETEALAPSGFAILNDLSTDNRSEFRKQLLQSFTGYAVSEISNVKLFSHQNDQLLPATQT